MSGATINLCYPCGHFGPGDEENTAAGLGDMGGAVWPHTSKIFWEKLKASGKHKAFQVSGGTLVNDGTIQIPSLNETWCIDVEEERIVKLQANTSGKSGEWDRHIPFPILVYLASAKEAPAGYDMVTPGDLYPGLDFLTVNLEKGCKKIENIFGGDGEKFFKAAEALGGERVPGGDMAVRFHIFPKFVVDYILWLGDDEFLAELNILVDRTATAHLPGDAIGVALNLLSNRLAGK